MAGSIELIAGFATRVKARKAGTGDRNGRWHGPLDREAAFAKAAQLDRADMRASSICDP